MLEIRKAGINFDLPKDVSFDLIIENPFMLQDRIPSPFSLTFSLPATPGNLAKFNYPNRIASVQNYELINDVTIYIDGMAISSGTLKLDTYDNGVINAYYIGSAYIPKPDHLLYNVQMERNDTALCHSNIEVLSETGFYPSFSALLAATVDGSKNFVCPPVRIINDKQFADVDITATVPYTTYGDGSTLYTKFIRGVALMSGVLAKNIAQIAYVNFWNTALSKYRYQNYHMPNTWFPFVGYLFDMVFKGNITNNVFKNGELAKVVMETTYSHYVMNFFYIQSWYGCNFDNGLPDNSGYAIPFVPYFTLNSSCPASKIGDFLKDVLKMFCVSIYAKSTGGYEMAFGKDVLNSTEADDWTGLVAGDFILSLRKRQTYKYGYQNVLNDLPESMVYQNRHIDMLNIPISSLPVTCKVAVTGEIYKISLPAQTDEILLLPGPDNTLKFGRYYIAVDDYVVWHGNDHKPKGTIIYVNVNDFVFNGGRLMDVSPDLWQFECVNQGMGGYVEPLEVVNLDEAATPDGDYSMESSVAPLPMSIDSYWWDNYGAATFGRWLVPVQTEDRYSRPSTARIGIYHGLQKAFNNTDSYPYVSSHNYDTQGSRIGDLSLSWDGDDGLLANYHQEFKAWTEKNKKAVTAYMRLDALTLKNLDLKRKKNIMGVDFFIEKISVSIKWNSIELAQVDLLEA